MTNLKVDPLTGDLAISRKNIEIVKDEEAIVQLCERRLGMMAEDYFLDKTKGIPFIQKVFVKSTDRALVDSYFKDIIKTTKGVIKLVSYKASFVGKTRTYKISFEVLSDYGVSYGSTAIKV